MKVMQPILFKYSLLVCILLLPECCTGAASETDRTIWVSTTGEDSPQCILDAPASDAIPHPRHLNESCASLNYALTHVQNETLIVIGCGIHVLKPVDSLPDGTPLLNVAGIGVMGVCDNGVPQIQCCDGANLAFYNVQFVGIDFVAFQDCGEQLQHYESLARSSTLYFQDCNTVLIQNIYINITGPYGRGISFIRYDTSITHGEASLDSVVIYHFGFHGSGIHFEVLTGSTKESSVTNDHEKLQLNNIYVENDNIHSIYNLAAFIGINITVIGDGEGGVINLTNVVLKGNTRCITGGISIALLDRVHGYNVSVVDSVVSEKPELHHNTGATFNTDWSKNTKTAANNSTTCTHSSVKVEVRGNSARNRIQIVSVIVSSLTGNALTIEISNRSDENVILLQGIRLQASNMERGLQVRVTGWARRNDIQAMDLESQFCRARWGAGGYIEFSEHAMENSVEIRDSLFEYTHAIMGGGIALVCKDFASQNTVKVVDTYIFDGSAELGGGVYLILQDSSDNNTIHITRTDLIDNTAHCGGGMFIHIQNATKANKVELFRDYFARNTLLPSEKHDRMGGAVHVEFSTVSATSVTNNIVNFTECAVFFNSAEQGIGGGISMLYKHSAYQGDSGDRVIVDNVTLFHNTAASGSACAFQSLPTHGKRLFRGVIMTNTEAHLTTQFLMTLFPLYMDQSENDITLNKVHMKDIQNELTQNVRPSFQANTNTSLILAKSVQIMAGNLNMQCGASTQGIYALDSEIIFQSNTWGGFTLCVATHGGAFSLNGESYIRVGKNVALIFNANHAFQRGGAIYASSAPGLVPVSNCFLQLDQDWEENRGAFIFYKNSAMSEGQSVYIKDIRNCLSGSTARNTTRTFEPDPEWLMFSLFDIIHLKLIFLYDEVTNDSKPWRALQNEVVAGSNYVNINHRAIADFSNPLTMCFIPGIQKRLPYTHAYDELGNIINTVFTVVVNKKEDSIPVQPNPFSKFTADFTVILHGIPQQHGMANHSFPSNTGNTSAVVRPPQLVLQSVDNTDLLLVMNIELQCCPPGYVFRYGPGRMGTCHCGVLSVVGIADCKESHPEKIGAVLKRDHWAGYLPSNDQHSCDGQKFFTGQCPPGHCQTQQITLPQNNSQEQLQEIVCSKYNNRKGLLCGDCLEGKGTAVNFNGIRPVCVSCEEGLSKVGILMWILS